MKLAGSRNGGGCRKHRHRTGEPGQSLVVGMLVSATLGILLGVALRQISQPLVQA
jgi:hypothetical protein